MQPRVFQFNKLVRDIIPDAMKREGNDLDMRELSSDEFVEKALIKIFSEEIPELEKVESSEEALSECADISELHDILMKHNLLKKEKSEEINNILKAALSYFKLTGGELDMKKSEKVALYGSFEKHIYVSHVIIQEATPWLDHYLKYPDKYPEISNGSFLNYK